MTIEAIIITALLGFIVNGTTGIVNRLTFKMVTTLKEKPMESMILMGVIVLLILQIN